MLAAWLGPLQGLADLAEAQAREYGGGRWVIDGAFMSDLANYMDRMKELGLIAAVPDINKLVVRDFAKG